MTRERFYRIVATLCSLPVAGPALADPERIGTGYYNHMWGGGWGIMGAGTMILFWVFVIVLVIVAVRWLPQQGHRMDNGDKSALRTLEERLAKGEIDVAEFEDRKKALTS